MNYIQIFSFSTGLAPKRYDYEISCLFMVHLGQIVWIGSSRWRSPDSNNSNFIIYRGVHCFANPSKGTAWF